MNRFRSLLVMFAIAGCTGPAALPFDVDDAPTGSGAFSGNRMVSPFSDDVIQVRQVDGLAVEIRDTDRPLVAPQIPESLRLNLFADATYDARLVRVEQQRSSLVWVGEVIGSEGSSVELAVNGDAVSGVVRVDGRLFTVQPRVGGPYIIEWDRTAGPADAPSVLPDAPDAPDAPAAAGDLPTRADGDTTVDVLVLYTGEAASVAGGVEGIEAIIDSAVQQANDSYAISGIPGRVVLLDARQTTYDETDLDFATTLDRLGDPDDGFMDDAHTLRDALGADHVVLMIDHAGPYAGLGYQLTGDNVGYFERYAFSVVSRDYAAGHFTFAHELGHNMGANHDPANAPDGGYRGDSTGHRVPNAEYRTIMAYSCADGQPCPRVGVWSNPDRDHAGFATGVRGVSDNAGSLGVTMGITAGFRARTTPPPMSPPPTSPPPAVPAQIVSPSRGATLPAGPVRFEWTDVDADAHRLMVGRGPGGDEFVNVVLGSETSFLVERLPEGGETLHVRLWSRVSGEWVKSDHIFTAYEVGAFRPAEVIFPGDQLPGAWAFFAWERTPRARRFRLEVGTAEDPTRYFQQVGREDYALVLGLPVDGSRVVARLMTEGPDGWVTRESVHEAFRAPDYAATFTSPSNGSRLLGVAVTFRWTTTAADRHWLVVGDGDRIIASTAAEGQSARVYGLPRDGRDIYAVLYSHGDEGWTSTTAAFLATR